MPDRFQPTAQAPAADAPHVALLSPRGLGLDFRLRCPICDDVLDTAVVAAEPVLICPHACAVWSGVTSARLDGQ